MAVKDSSMAGSWPEAIMPAMASIEAIKIFVFMASAYFL
jgi:hypothetical protein